MEEMNKPQRKDLWFIDPRLLTLEEGFNTRTDFGDLEELKNSILENGVKIPLRGYKVRGEEKYVVNDGHRRYMAVMMAIKEGNDIARVPFISEDKKSMEERLFEILLSNDGKPLTSLELGETYRRLKNFGYNATEIAKKVGKSTTHILDMIEVAESNKGVKDAINEGYVSATIVSEVKKSFEDKQEADDTITTIVEIKKEEGTGKIVRKDLKGIIKDKKKPEPKEDEEEEEEIKVLEHVSEKKYSQTKTYTEEEVAELLKKQISECAKQINSYFRSKVLNTPLVI